MRVQGSAEWEVDEVVAHRLAYENGFLRIQYKVRWLGWSPEDDSWLNESDLETCSDVVYKYQVESDFGGRDELQSSCRPESMASSDESSMSSRSAPL